MKSNQKITNKKIFHDIFEKINLYNNTLSVTLVGSFSQNFNYEKTGDIDIVVICNNLDKKYFDTIYKILISYKKILKKYSKKKKIKVNTSFGPIKYDNKDTLVLHLMIYDKKMHIEHVINSPFTCYDWERSSFYKGKKLEEIYPVLNLQLNDFLKSKRGIESFLKDIEIKKISYSTYSFRYKRVKLLNKKFLINEYNKKIFCFNIIKYSLNNLLKFENQKNVKFSNKFINKKLKMITKNEIKFKNFYLNSSNEFLEFIENNNINEYKLVKRFLVLFKKYINKYKENVIHIYRHKKTKINKNIFLGRKINPYILNDHKNINRKKINYSICLTSPMLRAKQTANILCPKKVIKTTSLINEINYGKYEGLSLNQIKNIDNIFFKKLINEKDPRFPEGENIDDVSKRVERTINKLFRIIKNYNFVAIVSHNVFIRCFIGKLLNINYLKYYKIDIPYFSKYEILIHKDKILLNVSRKRFRKVIKNIYE